MPLALFGFGRHATPAPSAAPALTGHIVASLQAVPIGIWIAAIGLVTAIAGPLTAHLLERRRDKA